MTDLSAMNFLHRTSVVYPPLYFLTFLNLYIKLYDILTWQFKHSPNRQTKIVISVSAPLFKVVEEVIEAKAESGAGATMEVSYIFKSDFSTVQIV